MKRVFDFSKERTCLNAKKNNAKWYASTKMHSDMIMPRCKLVSLRSITKERVMPQYRAISEMLQALTTVYVLIQSSQKYVNNDEKAMLL